MRRLIIAALLLITMGANAQTNLVDKLQVKTSFKLGSRIITSISDDTTGSSISSSKLITERAAKLLVTSRLASFSSLPSQTGQAGKFLTTNGSTLSWATVAGGGGAWGSITGTLSSQTDLQSALDGKEGSITAGTTGQYWRGDKSWQILNATAVGLGNVPNTDATNASNITSGTLDDARLGSNVAFKNSAQTFSNSITATSFIKSGSNSNAYLKGDGSTSTIYYGYHPSVYVATAAALPACTYSNGTSGIGATLVASSNGALSVDGIAATTGMTILVKNQTNSSENGIYTVTQTGSGASVFILTRRVTEDEVLEMDFGFLIYIQFGTSSTFTYSFSNNLWIGFNPTNAPSYSIIFSTYVGAPGSFSGDVIMQSIKRLAFAGSTSGNYIVQNALGQLEHRVDKGLYIVKPTGLVSTMLDVWDVSTSGGAMIDLRDNNGTQLYVANHYTGVNTYAATSTLTVGGSFSTSLSSKSANYTCTATDNAIKVTAASITITLPTAIGITGREYLIINASSGSITVATTSSQTIGNYTTSTTLTIPSDGSYTLKSDGTNWLIKSKF